MPDRKAKTLTQHETSEAPIGSERPHLEERVLDYFHRNSHAMDSADGVARFWVGESHGLVERCLVDLHSRGLLLKRTLAGTDFYSLQEELQRPTPQQNRPAADSQAQASGRILIADDDASVLKLMADVLGYAGYRVATASTGGQAIEMFCADVFDLVVTDVVMPGASGIEVLQTVKRHCPAAEVIVVTAHASLEIAIEALRYGAYDLITKPFDDIDMLRRVVQRALDKKRLSSENVFLVEHLKSRNVELKETVARLAALNEIGQATTALLDLEAIYNSVVRLVSQHLKARRVSILLSETDAGAMSLVASVGITDPDALNRSVRVGEGIAGQVAAGQAPVLVPDIERSEYRPQRTAGRYATSSFMISPIKVSFPIRYQHRQVGVINVSDKLSGDPFDEQDMEFLSTLAAQVAVAIENARLVTKMEGGYIGALAGLIRGFEDSRPETRGHSARVAELAAEVARSLKLAEPRVTVLLQAAALHEIGRLSSPSGNGGPVSGFGEAWTSSDAMAAERILAPIDSLRTAREIILRSPDCFATASLPFGSGRAGIPLESRILGTCEEFVRLTPATGQDPEQAQEALRTIQKRAEGGHDPEIVAALRQIVERIETQRGGAA